MPLSREHFVNICTQAILHTRENLSIANQLSGYKKFHKELKENYFLTHHVRKHLTNTNNDEYVYRHDLIRRAGIGNCHELSDFLLVEIGKELNSQGECAVISLIEARRITKSNPFEHAYLQIKIKLENETTDSLWEVDAWDPRVIDISAQPNGSIKNQKALDYGPSLITHNVISTDKIDYSQKYLFFKSIPKAKAGIPSRNATPEPEMLDKHKSLHKDYIIDDAISTGKLPAAEGELHELQEAASWQL